MKIPEDNPLNIDSQFLIPPNEIIPGLWRQELKIDVIINLTGQIRVIFPQAIHLVIGLDQPFGQTTTL